MALTPRSSSSASILSGWGLDLAVARVEGLGAQFQAVERGVAGQGLPLVAGQGPLLAQQVAFAAK
jgi:hypothetical protein